MQWKDGSGHPAGWWPQRRVFRCKVRDGGKLGNWGPGLGRVTLETQRSWSVAGSQSKVEQGGDDFRVTKLKEKGEEKGEENERRKRSTREGTKTPNLRGQKKGITMQKDQNWSKKNSQQTKGLP